MRLKLLLFASAAWILSPSLSHAQSLSETVQKALSSHPQNEEAQATLDAAREDADEQFSGYFPKVSVGTTGGRIYGDNATSRGLSTTRGAAYSYLWEGNISARQMLFDGFETDNKVRAANARAGSAKMSAADTREQLAARATQAYIELLRARTGLAMLKTHEKKVDNYLARIKSMVDQGAADEADHQMARDVRVILDGLITDYTGQVRAAEGNMLEIAGALPDGEMKKPAVPLQAIPANSDEAMRQILANHPALRAAALSAKSSTYDIQAQNAQLYPDVSGELSYLKSDKRDLIGGELEDARAVVKLNWAFDTGGATMARIARSRDEERVAQARQKELERTLMRDVRLAYAEYDTAREQLGHQEKRRSLNKILLETYTAKFEGAQLSLLQLMQADNQLFITGLEKMNGEHRVLAAQFAIIAGMGRMQEALGLGGLQKVSAHEP